MSLKCGNKYLATQFPSPVDKSYHSYHMAQQNTMATIAIHQS